MGELLGGEVMIMAGEVLDQPVGQHPHVTRRAQLSAVGQTRGIAEGRPVHAQLAGLGRHSKGEVALRSGKGLGENSGDVVGRLDGDRLDRRLHGNRLPPLEPQPRCRLARRPRRHLHRVGKLEAATVQGLEDQIKSHHLGQGRRVVAGVLVDLVQHAAAVGVDNEGGVLGVGVPHRHRQDDNGAEKHGKDAAHSGLDADFHCFPPLSRGGFPWESPRCGLPPFVPPDFKQEFRPRLKMFRDAVIQTIYSLEAFISNPAPHNKGLMTPFGRKAMLQVLIFL